MKILYLMHVDWNWIKQRPHFIAEKLFLNEIEVNVFYQKYFYKKRLTANTKGQIPIKATSLKGTMLNEVIPCIASENNFHKVNFECPYFLGLTSK